MRAERDLLGPPRDRSAHGVVGALVLPGGVVGLLPCGVVAVGVGVAVVGEFVRPGGVVVVGTTVGGGTGVTGGMAVGTVVGSEVGTPVGVVDGVSGVEVGPSPDVPELFVGRGVSIAISAGGTVGRCLGLAASGSGMSGVSIRGPPRRLLAMSTR
ncbi:hypothetical protein EV649_7753 [Kribbella sp. VKM Ac-2569]|nr:hypothetical protein EV649_7753 [Kribbella sp. VKM Ac-2569]